MTSTCLILFQYIYLYKKNKVRHLYNRGRTLGLEFLYLLYYVVVHPNKTGFIRNQRIKHRISYTLGYLLSIFKNNDSLQLLCKMGQILQPTV